MHIASMDGTNEMLGKHQMTVLELIEQLHKCNPNDEVFGMYEPLHKEHEDPDPEWYKIEWVDDKTHSLEGQVWLR